MSYTPNTPEDIRQMLAAIGVASIEELFAPIPAALRAKSFDLPAGMSEFEMLRRMRQLADCATQCVTPFVGGGFYDHAIPAVVDHLSGRAEFYTAYTPYQPECSQGTLQALFEYQSAICALTGMEVSNASLYDGGTALAEAAMMALRITGRSRLVVDGGVNPATRAIVRTYLANMDVEIVEVMPREGGTDRDAVRAAITDTTAALLVQNPNFFGTLDDLGDLAEAIHGKGGLLVASVYPISLGLVKSPAEMGADIAVGDGQSLGNPLSFGGPSFGFITTTKQFIRNMPGRIIGETVDREGRRGFVLTLQAREQHIKRHKATSNICSNQSLCALRGLVFLASLGRQGFAELARLNYDKAEYAKERFAGIRGVSVLNVGTTFNEFTVALPRNATEVVEKLMGNMIAAGVPLGPHYPEMERCMVVTVTEQRTKEEIDLLAQKVEGVL
ncbi:aminomethyl-transferring glycine dehydrogenase subunit GcvPA [Geobacter sp. DSM 9736]|uniref:aminomethyl-transferring glycine dehydrogenase subunit GcvPA n=1 Tax=Geobacter sp. DSM 9736 TaxID=1277350 RepID=UPI000B504953|nr:aminomethyl-transferring glycine dehydrogenase subunit GcvPA [Geobacter sp. DSM 9736]SNB47754.1 glycine dehydrogenase (decarboxylating) alpha subunit [Geobacter sp. DSM 9736]